MSGPVDVIKVLSHHEAALRAKCGTPLNELAEARAAVAELIEAAQEVRGITAGDEAGKAGWDACARLDAALARAQGDQ